MSKDVSMQEKYQLTFSSKLIINFKQKNQEQFISISI